MHQSRGQIVNFFRDGKDHTTSEVVVRLYPQEMERIERQLADPVVLEKDAIKEERARLHRRVLHHINRLVSDGILEVTQIQARGEKGYRIRAVPGQSTARPYIESPSLPIQTYIDQSHEANGAA